MKKPVVPMSAPGRLTVLATLLAGLCAPAASFAASDLVISQVYGGGGNVGGAYTHDFIELFNRGTIPINLNGMSVQYASAAGTSWAVTPLGNKTLAPGQYFLVREAVGGNTSLTALPDADAIGTIAMSGTAGKVALSSGTAALTGANPTAGVLDKIGYGSNANGFETAPAAGTANGTGARRIIACQDTDDNSTEFAVVAPTARNMATPLAPCGGIPVYPIVVSCPASVPAQQGLLTNVALSASDEDGIVQAATITGGAVPGITLGTFSASAADGADASVSLMVGAGVPVGTYPVAVKFTNNGEQEASCTISVKVQTLNPVTLSIPQIQGPGAATPVANSVQTTEGVVTRTAGNGFFIQDENGDGDPTTSDGIFVYMNLTPFSVAPGDRVRVTGTVVEFTPSGAALSYTELKDTTQVFGVGSGTMPTPANVTFGSNLEPVEGMLVRISDTLTVNQTAYLGERGELSLGIGRNEIPTNRYRPGTPEALAMAAANAKNVLILDDGIFVTPTTIPYLGQDGTVRAGDTVSGLTGVIDYGPGGDGVIAYKLHATVAPLIDRSNPRQATPLVAAGNVKVASANVLNYFTTFTNGTDLTGATGKGCGPSNSAGQCRGADNLAEYIRQRDKIVNSLKAIDADVVGLMEIQNNGDIAAQHLVDALNAAIGVPATYAVVPKPAATGTDLIRVAMIYKPAKATLVGGALSDGDSINNRPPMAQTFMAGNGEKFSVIVNHLKSKASCSAGSAAADKDSGDGQGCWNLSRIGQANRLASYFIPAVVAAAGDPDVLVIGDMNSYGQEDPIQVLTAPGVGMVNQLERFVRPEGVPYSYIFSGESGYLDHALASASLSRQVAGATEWHNNADEPTVIDYNTNDKSASAQALYTSDAFRASDHDPVVVSLNLAPAIVDVTASFTTARLGMLFNRATQKYTGTFSFTNKTGSPINGPFNVEFGGLSNGVTLTNATGQHNGLPFITVSNTSVAPGATVSVPLVFTDPSKVGITYNATIYAGTF